MSEQIVEMTKPRWVQIADRMRAMQVDEVLTYGWLMENFPDTDFQIIRQDVHRAIKEVEKNDERTFECVREVGYRMVAANEHFRLAQHRHKKARRQVVRAITITEATRVDELTDDERRRNDVMLMNSQRLKHAMLSVSKKKYPVAILVTNED